MDNKTNSAAEKRALHNACPLCKNAGLKDKYRIKGYTATECPRCSVIFIREKLSGRFLEDFYLSEQDGNSFYRDDNKDCINHYNRRLRHEIEKVKPGKGRILDVGCSSGFFLELMNGWERHGIEISEEYGLCARRKIGGSVFIGTFENYPVKENYFDVITLFDVLDHFADPVTNIQKCRSMLKPGGLLVIKVHNISCLFARIFGSRFYAFVPPVHLFYFNKKSLGHLLEEAGFKLREMKFIGHVMRLSTVFFRLSQERRDSVFFALYRVFSSRVLRAIKVYKNLHDIVTVFAVKN